jgi:hypothetical protein
VASKKRYLIGPELLPAFSALVKICLGTLIVLFLLGVVANLGGFLSDPVNSIRYLGQAMTGLIDAALRIIGILVIIFAVIQRLARARPLAEEVTKPKIPATPPMAGGGLGISADSAAADEADLPHVPPLPPSPDAIVAAAAESVAKARAPAEPTDPDSASRTKAAFSMAFVTLALILISAFPRWLGLWIGVDSQMGFVPLAGPGFDRWLWLLYVMLAITFVRSAMLFFEGRWSVTSRGLDLLDSALLAYWLFRLFGESTLIEICPDDLLAQGWSQAAVDKLSLLTGDLLPRVVKIGLLVGVVFAGIDVVKKARKLWGTWNRSGV